MKLHLICGKDDFRPNMQHVLVTKEYCVATNANVMGVIPTKDIFDEESIDNIPESGLLIHSDNWKHISDSTTIFAMIQRDNTVTVQFKKKQNVMFKAIVNGDDYKYPNWSVVIPKSEDIPKEFTINVVGINATLLKNLQDALGELVGLKLSFVDSLKAIRVDSVTNPERFGVIMPFLAS
jgi:hypothetical protein